MYNWQVVFLQLGGLGEGLISPHFTITCYKSHVRNWDGLGSLEWLRVFGRPKGKRPLGWSGCRRIIWKFISKEYGWKMLTGFIWLRIRTIFRVLWTWYWTLGLHKVQDVSWLEKELLASKIQLLSMNLIICSMVFQVTNSANDDYNTFRC